MEKGGKEKVLEVGGEGVMDGRDGMDGRKGGLDGKESVGEERTWEG